MNNILREQISFIRSKTDFIPDTAVILGSGLGALADETQNTEIINYSEIPEFPVSTAPEHKGRFVFGKIGDKNVVFMQGRVHLYEGYSSQQIANPIRLMKLMGAKQLLITNASGGIRKDLAPGDFMIIEDHISCFVPSPLIGKNDDSIGTRFPDMSKAYSKRLSKAIEQAALNNGITVKKGVYLQLRGPQFETPAEIKMCSNLGADAVGMSTAIEAIAGVHCGLEVCGISCITNYACGILDTPLSGSDVTETANRVSNDFKVLIKESVKGF